MEPLSEGNVGLSSFGGVGRGGAVPPAQVVVDLAPGYTASAPAVGSPVGLASVTSISGSSSAASLVLVAGLLTADDPARYASDPAAQACAPGPYTAVWNLATTVLGLSYTLPIFVGHPAGDAQRVELRFCPPPLTDAAGKPVTVGPVPLTSVDLLTTSISGPTRRGRYTSSALVTPDGGNGLPDPVSTVEARSLDPIAHTLTLTGRYDRMSHDAVLSGRVTEVGKPQARAVVEYFRLESLTEPRRVRTSAKGSFTARVRIGATSTFVAQVFDATVTCPGPSPAPRGCASLTVVGSNSRSVRVVVPPR